MTREAASRRPFHLRRRARRTAEQRIERERLARTDHVAAVERIAGRTLDDVRRAALAGTSRQDAEAAR
jgi:hypothetical protein